MDALDEPFVALSRLGTAGLLWIVAGLVLALAWRRVSPLVVTAVAVWSADLIAVGLKAVFGRDRPFETFPDPEPLLTGIGSASFPSGHAATAAAGATVLSLYRPRYAAVFALLAAATAFSRVYVGVHYLSDVLVGAAIGVATALLTLAAARRRSARAPRPG